jgi:glutathione S-transferase
VDLKSKTLADGTDFRQINPKGYVPLLELDDGRRLTEVPAIVQYIADQKPELRLAPLAGTFARYLLQEWLNYVSSEIHKAFAPFFDPEADDGVRDAARDKVRKRLAFVEQSLGGRQYLLGEVFTVADAYLYTILRWASPNGIDIGSWPRLKAWFAAIGARPHVGAALKAEGE